MTDKDVEFEERIIIKSRDIATKFPYEYTHGEMKKAIRLTREGQIVINSNEKTALQSENKSLREQLKETKKQSEKYRKDYLKKMWAFYDLRKQLSEANKRAEEVVKLLDDMRAERPEFMKAKHHRVLGRCSEILRGGK